MPDFSPHFTEDAADKADAHKRHVRGEWIDGFVGVAIVTIVAERVDGFETVRTNRPGIIGDNIVGGDTAMVIGWRGLVIAVRLIHINSNYTTGN